MITEKVILYRLGMRISKRFDGYIFPRTRHAGIQTSLRQGEEWLGSRREKGSRLD